MSETSARPSMLERMRMERDKKLNEMIREAGLSNHRSRSPLVPNIVNPPY